MSFLLGILAGIAVTIVALIAVAFWAGGKICSWIEDF